MKKGMKMSSILLAVLLVLVSSMSAVSAASDYTVQSLGEGFQRIILSNKAFAANTAREFQVEIPADGSYAVYLNKTETANTAFVVSFKNGTKTVDVCKSTTKQAAYAETYGRMGAAQDEASVSAELTKGNWTLSIMAVTAVTVSYIDIRSTVIPLDGSKQAIYPSDYTSLTPNVETANYINRDMNKNSYPKESGYTYYADYDNSALADRFTYGRGIHLASARTVTYKVNAEKAGTYQIKFKLGFYLKKGGNQSAVIGQATATANGKSAVFTYTFAAGQTGAVKAGAQSEAFLADLKAGINDITLKIDSDLADAYIWSVTTEALPPYLGDGFTRITLDDEAFTANTAREFAVEIMQDGDYAVFLNKKETTTNNFTVTFTKDGETKTLWNRTSANDSYSYNYVRVGGETGYTSPSVSLTKGTWIMSVKAVKDMTVSYMDIRATTILVNGTKQAIYPSDYNTVFVGYSNYVNGQISKSEYLKVSGYTYYADYENPILKEPFTYGRGIHVDANAAATYKLNVAEAGSYRIKIDGKFRNSKAVTAGEVATAALSIDGNPSSSVVLNYAKDTAAGAKTIAGATYDVTLAKGINTLTVQPDANSYYYITSLTIEAYNPYEDYTVVLAKDEVASYMAAAKVAYEKAEYADYTSSVIGNYEKSASAMSDIPKPVSLSWDAISGADSYTLKVSKTEDFTSDVLTFENIKGTSYDVYNLFVDTMYYWKVSGAGKESDVKMFYTDKTARYIYADGIRNVRDVGGWNGLNQGYAFRGSEMDLVDNHGLELTDAGRKVLHDDLGIKTDLDFRKSGLPESPIGSDVALIEEYNIGGYLDAFSNHQKYAGVMKTFADIDNYPIYFHCWGGADRTGTVAFLLEALCGVSETDLSIDFELTSFSIFGRRPRHDSGSYLYASTMAKLKEYEGDTLAEKAENYMLNTLKLTKTEIANIRSILAGSAVVFEKEGIASIGRNSKLALKNVRNHTISSVTVNGKAVEYSLAGNILTVKATEVGEGIITFDDGNTLEFSAEETSSCEAQVLESGFIRLHMQDTEFIGGETYKFPVTIAEDGEYTLFLYKEGTESNNFKVTFEQGGTVKTLANGGTASSAYTYNYVRANSRSGESPASVALTAGDWILNITPAANALVDYIDIRATVFPITGAAQAIYPSDFNSFTGGVGESSYVNGQMSKTLAKVSGYRYIGDYANEALAAPFAGDRQIHFDNGKSLTYKLNVKQAGTYRITYNHYFYLANAQTITEAKKATVTVQAGGSEVGVKSYTYSVGGTTIKTNPTDTVLEVPLAAGVQTLTFTTDVAGSYLCHLTIEKNPGSYNDKVVSVDNTLTRIEADSTNNAISAGSARSFDFTVPVDGKYNFYAHIGNAAMNMNVLLKNLDTGDMTTIYDGTLSVINPVKLRRLGMGQTPAIALTANTKYRLYLTPDTDISVPFIDVMHVTLPVNGKTAISPQYYSATNITDAQINCNDQQNKIKPESGYTLVGNFLSSNLAAQSGFNTGYAVTPHISNKKNFTYTLQVEKAGVYQIQVDAGSFAGSYTDNEMMEISVDGITESAKYTRTDQGVERLTGPSVYLAEGTHTLVLNNPDGGKAGFYLHQILVTPVAGAGVEVNGNSAIVSAYLDESYTGLAMIALYSADNELVGLAKQSLTGGDYVSANLTLSGTPAMAKVFVWNGLDSVTPLMKSLEVTKESSNWSSAS